MSKVKQAFGRSEMIYALVCLIVAVLLPLIYHWLHISVVMRMGTLFIGFNSLFALGSGVYLRKTRQPWYLMLVFPILFLGMVYWRYARYNYALVIAYLLMAYVAYGLAKPHEMQNNK